MGFRVLHPGAYSLLVDLGRPHSRSLGMPVGGAADRASYLLGNALVGNPPDAVALEMTLVGPRLEANDSHIVAVMGADFRIRRNGEPQSVGKTFPVRRGDLLSFQPSPTGIRAYLCVAGGFASPRVLESCSTWAPLHDGQVLSCPSHQSCSRFVRLEGLQPWQGQRLRVLRGSHADLVGTEVFITQEYRVQSTSNRMGLRLRGTEPFAGAKSELLSAPVCPGTVQLLHDGHPVVLGMDAQTIGGYPRIAQVIAADLDKLAQLRPGEAVQFQWVDLPTAERAWQARRSWLREWQTRLNVTLPETWPHPV